MDPPLVTCHMGCTQCYRPPNTGECAFSP